MTFMLLSMRYISSHSFSPQTKVYVCWGKTHYMGLVECRPLLVRFCFPSYIRNDHCSELSLLHCRMPASNVILLQVHTHTHTQPVQLCYDMPVCQRHRHLGFDTSLELPSDLHRLNPVSLDHECAQAFWQFNQFKTLLCSPSCPPCLKSEGKHVSPVPQGSFAYLAPINALFPV